MTDIEQIVANAVTLAKRFNHEYVTIEHMATVALDNQHIRTMCYEVQADGLGLQEVLLNYLNEECTELVIDSEVEVVPKKTQMLERIFNRALTQALFQGKRGINQFDLMLSILSEEHCATVFFADEFGLTKEKLNEWLHDAGTDTSTAAQGSNPASKKQQKSGKMTKEQAYETLEQFCTDMNEKSAEYDDVIGRREELRDLVQTLARKKKSNAVLVGPSGVGKTAIVEGLAKLIEDGMVPDSIKHMTVWSLEMSKMVAGTKYRGDFEERIKQLVEALEQLDDVIIFIDEIHTIIGAGQTGQGAMDAGNMLKPALTGGKVKVIGATTDEEYRKMFEKESALARRFTKLSVDEPTVAESKEILRNTLIGYEVYHGVEITPEASDLAVELSAEYIFNKKLPDKAFDIIDRACAYNRIMPEEQQVEVITSEEIRQEVSRYVDIPAEHLGVDLEEQSINKHSEVHDFLHNTVFGQDEAIQKVVNSITISMAGLKDPNKPVASYLFTGPTGVGKTEMAKRLSQAMSMKLVRFDMSEYQEGHSVSKLIGSPPGYVGHGDGKAGDGLLITALEDSPNCVLLLDEVEKAHPDIMTVLLALLDDGVITSSTGKKVSGKNAVIILTSNLGARESSTRAIGFGSSTYNSRAVDEAINKFFAPEFRNRLDGIVRFNALKEENMLRIVEKFLHQVEGYVEGRHIKLTWSNSLIEFLEKEGFDPAMGARPLGRLINERVKLPLSRFLMDNTDIKDIVVDYNGKGDTVVVKEHVKSNEPTEA
jgi:ATP-dependent Clp protease ATP-binding subunit ClpA